VFTILNYLRPDRNVLPMHASANVGRRATWRFLRPSGNEEHASRPSRTCWARSMLGETASTRGGCYAKSQLARSRARDLRHTERSARCWKRLIDPATGGLTSTTAHTENTRACYPLEFIPNALHRHAGTLRTSSADGPMLRRAAADSQLSPTASITSSATPRAWRHGEWRDRAQPPSRMLRRAVHAAIRGLSKMLGEKMARQHVMLAGQHRLVGRGFRRSRALSIRHTRPWACALDARLSCDVGASFDPDPQLGIRHLADIGQDAGAPDTAKCRIVSMRSSQSAVERARTSRYDGSTGVADANPPPDHV